MIVIFAGVLSFLPTKAFTLVCRPIHKHFGGDDITERQEHLHELAIPKLLREVVDEQVTAFRPCRVPQRWRETDRQTGRREGGKETFEERQKVSGIKQGLEEKTEYIDMRRMKRR